MTVTASLLARLANARFLGEDEGRGEEKGKAQLCERRHCCARDRLSGVKMCWGYRYRWYSYRSDVIYGCGEETMTMNACTMNVDDDHQRQHREQVSPSLRGREGSRKPNEPSGYSVACLYWVRRPKSGRWSTPAGCVSACCRVEQY